MRLSAFSLLGALLLVMLGSQAATASSSAISANGFDISNAIIPRDEIVGGGPPRDGIPSIDRPRFIAHGAVDFLRDDDLVVSLEIEGETRAYPLRILVWHEIVNDVIGARPIAVTYCPLCGTAMVFDRHINGRTLSFGVSGLLYQSDVLMFDRETESLWSQLAMKAISGKLAGTELRLLSADQQTWRAWREKHSEGEVLSTQTGYSRDYGRNAYSGYEKSEQTMFPVPSHRTELPKKEWVLGVILNGRAKAYRIAEVAKQRRVQDKIGNEQIEVSYDSEQQLPAVVNKRTGERIPFIKAYWFAWQAFYPETELYRQESP